MPIGLLPDVADKAGESVVCCPCPFFELSDICGGGLQRSAVRHSLLDLARAKYLPDAHLFKVYNQPNNQQQKKGKPTMKKVYCDRCGAEMEQNGNILLRKTVGGNTIADYFDICDTCRDSFFGWLNNKPAEQEKPVKVAEKPAEKPAKPAKKSAKDNKSNAYTAMQIAELSSAPVTTVRRHAEGICSTYSKDKQGRTIRRYHLTDDQLAALLERIKSRQQGKRTKI